MSENVHSGVSLIMTGYVWWLIIPCAAILGVLIAKLYSKETTPFSGGFVLRMLRAAVVVILVLLLSQPIIHRVTAKNEPPVVVVLRDQSSSMSVKDAHEPLEKKVRAAVVLGLLDAKLRDLNAEQAEASLNAAQNGVDSATGGVRQALQQLQESGESATGVQERLTQARKNLTMAGADARKAAELLSAAPLVQPHQKPAAVKSMERAETLERELGDVPLKNNDAKKFLMDKAQSLKVLKQDLAKSAGEARKLQDRVDRALGESGKPPVKSAIESIDKMDRFAFMTAVLEKAAAGGDGERARVVTYNIDTDLRSPDGKALKETDLETKEVKPDKDAKKVLSTRDDTDLATPLLRLAERHAHDTITAVVLCSDGRHTSGPTPEEAARALSARGIALHTLGVGSIDAPPDICVARLDGTLSVFLEETIRLTAHIKASGYKGKKCKLILRRGDKEIQRREVALGDDGWIHQEFELTADKAGPNAFTASVEPMPKETLTSNNSADAVVDVANDRLKVLVVDELPRWETRYVASMLRRERKMTLTERWLMTGDNIGPRPKALPEEQKGLEEYDIIVLGDIMAERLDDGAQRRLAKYVADGGGFLVVIAGQKAMPRSYPSGALADLLPIRQQMPSATAAALLSADASPHARVKLDQDGSRSEIIRVLRDPALNEQLWPALPELNWIARPAFAKPGATTLLYADDARKDAVVAVHSYGAGRVLYIGSDNTWRWRYKVGDRVHAVFWSQAMRWGTSNRLTGSERLKAGLDRRQIRPGENLEILARPRDKEGHAVTNAVVVAELEDRTRQQHVQLQPVPDSGGLYRGVLQNVGAGVHAIKVKVESTEFEGIEENLQVIAREVTGQEGVELSRDSSRLASMANAGSGRSLDILEAPQLFKELSGQGKQRSIESSYELWSSYPALLLVVALLAAEWLLRKKMGLA